MNLSLLRLVFFAPLKSSMAFVTTITGSEFSRLPPPSTVVDLVFSPNTNLLGTRVLVEKVVFNPAQTALQ
jgi:hypothetical protein